jgi:hypothetical protein
MRKKREISRRVRNLAQAYRALEREEYQMTPMTRKEREAATEEMLRFSEELWKIWCERWSARSSRRKRSM